MLRDDPSFHQLSILEGNSLMERDILDRDKLCDGIAYAVKKGILSPRQNLNEPQKIVIMGKTSDDICEEIIHKVSVTRNGNGMGDVITLEGLSGTGKGTTVRKLAEKLPNTITWSNGNIFRCLTFCLLRDSIESTSEPTMERIQNAQIDVDSLNPSIIEKCMQQLEFIFQPEHRDSHLLSDIRILPSHPSMNQILYVSEIQNTLLKYPNVSKHVPLVAERSQGEVILFTQRILRKITTERNWNVLIEGRRETLNYIETPHRFELVISADPPHCPNILLILGQRRAAQRVVGEILQKSHSFQYRITKHDILN
eukprot:CAMPEP_0201533234 /NCGR_PEP_ID=MMETSP0161_2-20130828/52522_1 /ASSEMBLY_ACC=CAM_ASM_000251 /TAXON_ID=180227 /ORGANISM="Neoparamoeba aestuarina, Strain SoJaBio B1-5/56/2" /LENGTH=310 /DNA_ID=CAMNT_0047937099 /DNA_START=87 /DNA_END=1016 /DNA_ORIENTATION=-